MLKSLKILTLLCLLVSLLGCGGTKKTGSKGDSQSYLVHQIIDGDTPESLTAKYRISYDDIRAANGGSLPALTPGTKIKIPKDKIGSITAQIEDPEDKMFDTEQDSVASVFREAIDFSILLPFYLEYNSKLISRTSTLSDPSSFLVHEKSLPALEFYEGARIAKKELSLEGIVVNLNAIDTENEEQSLEDILNSEDVKNSDMLIGSFGVDNNEIAVNLTRQNENSLVITKSYRANYLENNDHVIIAHPSGIMQCKMMAKFIQGKYETANIIIVNQETAREENLAGIFKSELLVHKSWSVPEYDEGAINLESFQNKLDGLTEKLEKNKKNIIVITSSSEFLVSRVMTKLYTELNEYDITVSGLPTWQKFQSIDIDVLQELGVIYFTTSHLDRSNPLFDRFRKMYIRQYYTEPSADAFDGYCMLKYLSRSMYEKGVDFRGMLLLGVKDFGKQTVDYHYVEEGGGLENRAFQILMYKDFDLQRLN